MFRFKRDKGKKADSSAANQAAQVSQDEPQEKSEAQGFLCPICKAAFQGPLELQNHFEEAHTEGGKPAEQPKIEIQAPLLSFEDRPSSPDGAEEDGTNRKGSSSSASEVIFLQQELADLAARLKEEIWYTSQLKQELDKVSAERDKLEEEKALTEEEYSSKLRSAENGFLQVAEENEKLKEELKYVDYKTQKERDSKIKKEIEDMKKDMITKDEKLKSVEDQNKAMQSEMNVKDEFLEALKRELEDRPSDSYIKELEVKNRELEGKLAVAEKNQTEELKIGNEKWTTKFEDMNREISSLQLNIQELTIEKNSKTEQINSLETALKTASESSQQSQSNIQEKQQQLISLQHNVDEVNASLKEKENFINYLEKQIEDYKGKLSEETQSKQNLQQELRMRDNQLEEEKRNLLAKDDKIQELMTGLDKRKEDIDRMEAEKSELLQQIEAGEGVQTAINQLKQEKEKLIDGVAVLEKEMEEQNKKYQVDVNQLREEKMKVNEELQSSCNQVVKLESELKQLTEQFNMTQKNVDELKTELKLKGDQLRETESEKSAQIGKLEAYVQQKTEVLQLKEQELTSLNAKQDTMASESANLRTVSSQLEAEVRSKDQELKMHKERVDNLQNQIESKEQRCNELNASLEKIHSESKAASDLAAKQEVEMKNQIKLQLEEMSTTREQLKSKEDQVIQLNTDLTKIIAEKEGFEQNLASHKNALNEEKAKNEKLKEDLENANKEKSKNQETHSTFVQEKEESWAKERTSLQEEYENTLSQVKISLAKSEEDLKAAHSLLEKERTDKTSLQNQLAKMAEEKDTILVSLEQKDSTLQRVQSEYEIAQQELKKACEGCKNYELQLCRLEETFRENNSTIEKLNAEKADLGVEIKGLHDALASKVEECENLKSSFSQQEDNLQTEITQLKEVKNVLEARVIEYDDELKEAFNRYDSLKAEKDRINGDLQEQREMVNQAMSDRDKAVRDLSLFESELKEREESWDKEKTALEEKHISLQLKMQSLTEELEDTHEVLSKEKDRQLEMKKTSEKMQEVLNQECSSLKNKIDNLEKEKESIIKSKQQSESSLNLQMTTMKENVQAAREDVVHKEMSIRKLEDKVKALESEKDEMHGDIAVLEAQIQHLGDEKKAMTERILQSEEQLKIKQEKVSEYKQRLDQSVSALHELGRENQNLQIKHNIQLTRQWEDDQEVDNCKACNKQFSMTVRKHHCRHCGSIFCNECSSYNIQVAASKKPVRCCLNCFNELSRLQGRRSSQVSIS